MRLAGQTRGGFYPIPPQAIEMLAARLRVPKGPFAMLDPCAGKGAAVGQLAGLLGCKPEMVHAIELDEGRAEKLKAAMPEAKVLAPASFLGCSSSWGGFSMIFLNPPFDDHFGGGRVEADFLRRATDWLMPGGVLALVCPEDVADQYGEVARLLKESYESVTVLPFADEWRRYGEVVALAVRRKKIADHWGVRWEHVQAPEGYVYRIPPGEGPGHFKKVEMTDLELSRALAASPLRKALQAPPEVPLPSPPMALGKGHIALLLASGHLDGVVAPKGEPPHVVRGTARKVEVVSNVEATEDKTVTTITERIELVVRTVDASGEIRTFGEAKQDE